MQVATTRVGATGIYVVILKSRIIPRVFWCIDLVFNEAYGNHIPARNEFSLAENIG